MEESSSKFLHTLKSTSSKVSNKNGSVNGVSPLASGSIMFPKGSIQVKQQPTLNLMKDIALTLTEVIMKQREKPPLSQVELTYEKHDVTDTEKFLRDKKDRQSAARDYVRTPHPHDFDDCVRKPKWRRRDLRRKKPIRRTAKIQTTTLKSRTTHLTSMGTLSLSRRTTNSSRSTKMVHFTW